MSRITMCLDCPEYQKGGYCRHTKRDVGALSPACDHALRMNGKFNPEDEDAALEQATPEQKPTKTCARCGRELPRSAFYVKTSAKDGLESYCIECKKEDERERRARRREAEGQDPKPRAYTKLDVKRCPHCERVLPLSEYYLKDGKPSWICKTCFKKYETERSKRKRDARSAQENAGATTRVCRVCGRDLPLDAYGSHAKTWDHKATVCKECMADRLRKNKTKKEDTMTDQEIQSAILMPDTEATMSPKTSGEPNVSPIPGSGCMPAPKHSPNVSPIEPKPETTAEHRPRQDPRLENFESKALADELRARGYRVTAARPITIIEEL